MLLLACAGTAWAQLPSPPPLLPTDAPGKSQPFDPNTIREAQPQPPIVLPTPAKIEFTGNITLVEAVSLAMQLQPDVLTARGQLMSAEGQVTAQRAALLPNLNLRSQFTHNSSSAQQNLGRTVPITNTNDQLQNTIGYSQLIFDFGHTPALVRTADLRRQAAAFVVLQTENDLALTVKERFYTLERFQRQLAVIEADVSNRQEQLRLARALYEAGSRSPGDVVRAQTGVSNSVVQLNNVRRDLDLAVQDLAQSLGLPPRTPLTVVEQQEPDLGNKDLNYLAQQAAERRPDLMVAQRNVEASEANLTAAETTNLPALTTFTGITYQGQANGIQYPAFSVQVALDFDFYDGGYRLGVTRVAEGQLEVSQAELKRVQLSVEREVAGAVLSLLTAERNLEAAQAASDSAVQGVRIAAGRYQAALGQFTDVLDAQTALVLAQTALVNARTELDLARARVRHSLAAPFGDL